MQPRLKAGWFAQAFLTGCLATGLIAAQEEAADNGQAPRFYVGVCAHFGQGKGIPELNLQQMRAAGINSLRDELSWRGTERQRGQYAIADQHDATFRRAAELGIRPMLIFDYANSLYDDGDRPRTPDALEGYTRYAEFLVNHFGDDVKLYEVWNEYNIGIGMQEPYRRGGSAEDYVRMLKHTYPRVKKIAPNVTVIGGAPTGGGVRDGWLEKIVQLGALESCDILSIHTYNYSRTGIERTPEGWQKWMLQTQEMLKKYHDGKEVPLLVTEMGWPTHVGKPNSTSPELSASYLGRLYLLARTMPFMRGVWWYDYQDDGWDDEYNENNFGLVRPDLTPKPSYHTMADVSDVAARAEYLGQVKTDDDQLWILRFRLDGQQLWALWSGDDLPRQVVLETDNPAEPLTIQQLGHDSQVRPWGHRAWVVKGRDAAFVPNQCSLVVGHRPWMIRGVPENTTAESRPLK
jgi:hypothetical protein